LYYDNTLKLFPNFSNPVLGVVLKSDNVIITLMQDPASGAGMAFVGQGRPKE